MIQNQFHQFISEHIEPLPNRYTMGEYTVRVLPRQSLDYDGVQKFWRLFSRYPNDFAATLNAMLPKDIEFRSYDHLTNTLTLFKK
jgi:hypothetical protein